MREFLIWLSGGLGASTVFSYLAERWSWFQLQSPDNKKLYKTVGASLLALASFGMYTYVPTEFWMSLDPFWKVVLGVIAVNYGVEVFHWFDKKVSAKAEQ